MFLEEEIIALRALEPEDKNLLYEWENDTALWKVSETLIPFSKFILEQFINESTKDIYEAKQLRLVICMKENGAAIGAVDLFEFDPFHLRCGVGIVITAQHRNKGYATKALELTKKYAFNILKLHQLYCNISENNKQSLALFQGVGFKITGRREQWLKNDEQWENLCLLQLINPR